MGPTPALDLLVALNRIKLAADESAIAALAAALRRFPDSRHLPTWLEVKLVDWIVSDVNPYSCGANPTGEIKGLFDPDAHAEKVIRALESRCKAIGVEHSLLPAVALQVANTASTRGTQQRNARRLDEARQTAACLSAFARKLVRRDPREPGFHLLLAQAFEQESKNAWQVFDYTAIKDALRKALGEARIGLRLDPRNFDARTMVAGLQEKLVNVPTEQAAAR